MTEQYLDILADARLAWHDGHMICMDLSKDILKPAMVNAPGMALRAAPFLVECYAALRECLEDPLVLSKQQGISEESFWEYPAYSMPYPVGHKGSEPTNWIQPELTAFICPWRLLDWPLGCRRKEYNFWAVEEIATELLNRILFNRKNLAAHPEKIPRIQWEMDDNSKAWDNWFKVMGGR